MNVGPRPTGRYVFHAMGMPVTLAMRGGHADDEVGGQAWSDVQQEIAEVDRVFSRYRPDSFVGRLNAGLTSVVDSPSEVAEVLELGERAAQRSDGAFQVWRDDPHGGRPQLDTDGIVKGWAVERAAVRLRRLHDTDFCLSAGGDMVCHTSSMLGDPWRIGVEDPHDPTRLVATVAVRRGAVATSGLVHRGDHIIDVRTGVVPAGVASVTVVADRLTWADIDATSAFAQGREAAAWLARMPGRSGLVVWADRSTTTVAGGRVLGRAA